MILDAALEALEAGDPHVLSMKRVAELAGISRQALYLHFDNRQALAVAIARYTDEKHDIASALAPMQAATDGATLLEAFAEFLSVYNPRIHLIVRMADALRNGDEAAQEAWRDRMQARHAGAREAANRLHQWGELSPEWTRRDAAAWLTAQASTRLYEEIVLDLGVSLKRYRAMLARAMRATLLADP